MTKEAKERMVLTELEYLREFRYRVFPHVEKYIQLMHLVGNHTDIAFLEIFIKDYQHPSTKNSIYGTGNKDTRTESGNPDFCNSQKEIDGKV